MRRSTSSTCRAPSAGGGRGAPRPRRPVYAETCPHYLALDDARYDVPDEEAIKYVISPPLRASRSRRAVGWAWPRLAWTWSPPTTCPTGSPSRSACRRQPSPRSATARRASRRCSRVVYSEACGRAGSRSSAWSTLLADHAGPAFGLPAKGAIEVGRDADLVLFDPDARASIAPGRPAPHQRLHALRGHAGTRRGADGAAPRSADHP